MRKQQKTNGDLAPSKDAKFKGFINYKPDKDEKERFQDAVAKYDLTGDVLSKVLESGYKLSTRYLAANTCFVATLFCLETNLSWGGYCLSMRGGDANSSIARVVYVHAFVLQEDWSPLLGSDGYDDEW